MSNQMGNTTDLTMFVIEQFAKHKSINEIVVMVAKQYNLSWGVAKQRVLSIQKEHRTEITRRQSGFAIVLSVSTVLFGCGLALCMVILWINHIGIEFGAYRDPQLPVTYEGNLLFFGLGSFVAIAGGVGLIRYLHKLR